MQAQAVQIQIDKSLSGYLPTTTENLAKVIYEPDLLKQKIEEEEEEKRWQAEMEEQERETPEELFNYMLYDQLNLQTLSGKLFEFQT